MKFRGAFFDADGTLMETESIQLAAWNDVLKKYNIELSESDYMHYAGMGTRTVSDDLIKKYSIDIDAESLASMKREKTNELLLKANIEEMPYAKEAVNYFHSKGMKTAICSNAYRAETGIKIGKTGFDKIVDGVFCRNDVKNGKPFPDIYLLACRSFSLNPKECFAIEDTRDGIKSAKSAGLYAIAIPNKYTRNQYFSDADYIAYDMKEVMRVF